MHDGSAETHKLSENMVPDVRRASASSKAVSKNAQAVKSATYTPREGFKSAHVGTSSQADTIEITNHSERRPTEGTRDASPMGPAIAATIPSQGSHCQ